MRIHVLVAYFLLIISTKTCNCGGMNEAQLTSVRRMVKNTCQPKNNITDEQIEGMHNGIWDQNKSAQCYMWCVLKFFKLITKENKFDSEYAIQSLNVQVADSVYWKKGTLETVEKCKDVKTTEDDKCLAAYEIASCIYMASPKVPLCVNCSTYICFPNK